jgi:hypothetical protein
MPYLILKTVTAKNMNDDSFTHNVGSVVSDWELSEFIKEQIGKGTAHYRAAFEPLTEEEATHHRVKATAAEGARNQGGLVVEPPWPDYVGLHPEEIIARMRASSNKDEIDRVKNYERAGMNRTSITDFTAPVEREPFTGYDSLGIREVLAKLAVLSEVDVQAAIHYEAAHQKRPAIIQYERESYETPSDALQESVAAVA